MYRLLIAAILISTLPGCFPKSGPIVTKVSGVITFYGAPLEGATVMFVPVQARDSQRRFTPIATGVTDQDGRYSLSLADGRSGAIVGQHRVLVSKIELPAMDQTTTDGSTDEGKMSRVSSSEKRAALQRAYDRVAPFQSSQPFGEVVFESFNRESQLHFEVTATGTSDADFEVGQDPLLSDD